METIGIIWIFLFFIIAVFLLITADRAMTSQSGIGRIVFKLFFSFLVHIPVSAITGFLLLFITVGADNYGKRKPPIGWGEITAGLILVLGNALTGWLLCSFVNGKLLKSFAVFNFYSEKPQSIFKAE